MQPGLMNHTLPDIFVRWNAVPAMPGFFYAGTAFQRTGFSPMQKMSGSVDEPFSAPAVLRATLQ
jgi:hypothetical protein